MAIGTALAIGGALAGSLGGAAISSAGASKQAKAAEQSSAQAIAEQRRQFDLSRSDLQPWLQAGTQAIQMLQYLLGLGVPPGQATQAASQATGVPSNVIERLQQIRDTAGGRFGGDGRLRPIEMQLEDGVFAPTDISGLTRGGAATGTGVPPGANPADFGSLQRDFSAQDFEADPGYAFRLAEGQKALERSAAARGTVLSGGTLKELTRYNQGFASNEFSNAYNRFQTNRATRFNQLASIAGLGQTTASTLADTGARNAATIGNLIVGGQTAAAAARASGYQGWANALQGASQIPLNWYMLSQLSGGGGLRGCWVAQAVYGEHDWRPEYIWQMWTKKWANESRLWRAALGAYLILGEPVAWFVKRSKLLKAIVKPIFERLLRKEGR